MKAFSIPGMILLSLGLILAGCQASPTPEIGEVGGQTSELDSEIVIEGRVVPQAYVTLSFAASSLVSEVLVGEGEQVAAGQVIARLGGEEAAQAAVKAAELELLSAQQSRQALEDEHSAALTQALVRQNTARQAAHEAEEALEALSGERLQNAIDGAQAQVVLAEDRLEEAREAYADYADEEESNTTRATYQVRLSEAQRAYDEAQRGLDALQGAGYDFNRQQAETAREAANRQLAEAQAQYTELSEGPDPDLVAAAEARLAAAETGLAAAQAGLESLELRSPMDGKLVETHLKVGEITAAGQPVVKVADLSRWFVETIDLTEIDVAAVQSGQAVEVIADALPEVVLRGIVMSSSETYQEVRGDVTYATRIRLEQADPRLRWGMTVLVTFSKP